MRSYNGPGNGSDYANAIAQDGSGNVYVTGDSPGNGTNLDYASIKYYSDGDTAWTGRYNGPGNAWDHATAIAVDSSGNIYVTGHSGVMTKPDYATIKYVQTILPPGTDLSLEIWGLDHARAGFNKAYSIQYSNIRSTAANDVSLSLTLPSVVTYVSSTPPGHVSGDVVTWDLGTVDGERSGSVEVQVHIPDEVTAGTELVASATISTPELEVDYTNNSDSETEMVVTSWDLNDKQAQPLDSFITTDDKLKYTIFFENVDTATAEAIFITIVDTLDQDLNWNTLSFGPMSHPDKCSSSFDSVHGVITWVCDSIMLPPNVNPPEGEGLVTFSIMPDLALPPGTQVQNRAYIQFDFNPWMSAPDSGAVIRTIRLCGDFNGDGKLTVSDVIYLINYLFRGGPPPLPPEIGDVNHDAKITVSDVIYLINYLFKGGPPPGC